jgi:glycosyltransferase involved in cell wall biosynthesis
VRKVKGLDVFLRAAAVVCLRFPDAAFAIIGEDHEPEHYRQLLDLAEQLGISSNVRFLGGIENPTPLLKASDVFCMLSRSEGLSNALLEAMACRLPCVVTRVGGNPEVVEEGSSGYIVASEDHAASGDRIALLLQDPVRARRMGCAGREIVEAKFSEAAMLARLVSEYEFLVSRKG